MSMSIAEKPCFLLSAKQIKRIVHAITFILQPLSTLTRDDWPLKGWELFIFLQLQILSAQRMP